MLTVDYDRLGVRAGELLLDLGAGNGRHAYEAFRRGVRVVAADFSHADMVECRTMCAAMEAAGEAPAGGLAAAAVRRRPAACRSPTPPSTGSSPPR